MNNHRSSVLSDTYGRIDESSSSDHDFENSNDDMFNVNSMETNAYNKKEKAENNHSFQVRFFYKPVLCVHCIDYVWGSGYIGYGCTKCAQCVHFKCLIFVAKHDVCKAFSDAQNKLDSITKSNFYPIENWSTDLVKQWLAVVNLHRYAEVFFKYNISGSKLITLNSEQLYEYRIRDSYHHNAIIECCKELLFKSRHYLTYSQMLKEQNEHLSVHLKMNPYKASRHHFLLHTISQQTVCHTCSRPLLGIVHQALICQQCGIMVYLFLIKI
jgi:hypothetical protein